MKPARTGFIRGGKRRRRKQGRCRNRGLGNRRGGRYGVRGDSHELFRVRKIKVRPAPHPLRFKRVADAGGREGDATLLRGGLIPGGEEGAFGFGANGINNKE